MFDRSGWGGTVNDRNGIVARPTCGGMGRWIRHTSTEAVVSDLRNLRLYRRWWFWIVLATLVLGAVAWWTNLEEHATDSPKGPLPMEQSRPGA